MKIILFCSSQSNQKALAHKIHNNFNLHKLIVLKPLKKKIKFEIFKYLKILTFRFLGNVITLCKFRGMWFGMLDYYSRKYSIFPIKPDLIVEDINNLMVEKIIDEEKPELVIVSGTNLLKERLISKILQYGKVMNLHTGISPYIKGGPDCTCWCLFLKEFSLIGNTVMWLDKGIDSGNIIATEQTILNGDESLVELKIKTMNHGHDLYLRAIERFYNKIPLNNIKQSNLSNHGLFLSKDWGLKEQIISLFNYYIHFRGSNIVSTNKKLISLEK